MHSVQACCEFKTCIFLKDGTSDIRHEITLADTPQVFSGTSQARGRQALLLVRSRADTVGQSWTSAKYSLKGRRFLLIKVQEN